MNASVMRSLTNSKCTALVAKHTNTAMYALWLRASYAAYLLSNGLGEDGSSLEAKDATAYDFSRGRPQ